VFVGINTYGFSLEGVSEIGFVRDDDSNRLFGVGRCVDADVANEVASFESRFETLKSDVLSRNAR
jgi:hypothetical protein